MNKFAVLAASLVASFALAFAVYSAESNPNTSSFPRVVAKVRLANLTQPIPTTTILNAPRTGLYRVSTYTAFTSPGSGDQVVWELIIGWTDESGAELGCMAELIGGQMPPNNYAVQSGASNTPQEPIPIEAIAGTPITYSVTRTNFGTGGTYELFISVEQLQ
jgi:hypothetical protein